MMHGLFFKKLAFSSATTPASNRAPGISPTKASEIPFSQSSFPASALVSLSSVTVFPSPAQNKTTASSSPASPSRSCKKSCIMFEAEHNPIENRKERIEELKHQLMRAMHSFGVDKITLGRNDIANVYVRFDTVGKDIVEFGSAMSGQSIQDSF